MGKENKVFKIELGDITTYQTDAIVNAANTSLLGGGGVDGAIHKAAGPELLEECKKLNGCKTGKCKITKGYNLPAKYVLHTPGPVWHGGDQGEGDLLECCYKGCLWLGEEYGCETIAFPSISTGAYGFPVDQAAQIAVEAIMVFLRKSPLVREVTMVCFDEETKKAYEKAKLEFCKNSLMANPLFK